ncbi:MAG: hypothetical protein GY777_23770 [Candidatus Brocadiaceae bacterium]|nr:hypothetical protein [Candidatus Brocadiaceae bacterium]
MKLPDVSFCTIRPSLKAIGWDRFWEEAIFSVTIYQQAESVSPFQL